MKTRLLKKLRAEGRNMVDIYSVTTCRGVVTGMSYSIKSPEFKGIFSLGDTEDDVRDKAMRIYIAREIERRRARQKR